MNTNRPMKKGDDKWAGPYPVLKVYPRACLVKLPEGVRIFPVFHNSLLKPKPDAKGLPGQDRINEAESRNTRGRVLEREDGTNEVIVKWEFDDLLDCHNNDGWHYKIKWRYHKPSWQPLRDLEGQEATVLDFHRRHPNKPGPPPSIHRWAQSQKQTKPRPANPEKPTTTQPLAGGIRRSPRLRRIIPGLKRVSWAKCVHTRIF